MNKTVVMLIGPKGSGKTHIGTVLEKRKGIKFLRVEPIWLRLSEGEDGWFAVERQIANCFSYSNLVVIESLGGSEGFERLRTSLSEKYLVKFVKVVVPLDACAERVKNRDSLNHIPISGDKGEACNQIAAKVVLPWSVELVNEPP